MNRIFFFLCVTIVTFACSQNTNTKVLSQSKSIHPGSTERVETLLGKMTLDEKIGQLNLLTAGATVTGSVVSTNVEEKIKNGQVGGLFSIRGAENVRAVQDIAVKNTRLGIPLIIGMDVIHGHQTIFPIPLGLSCSWDMDLIEKTAQVAAKEATADGICWNFSPMVDVARDPRWGRISEGAGEDPFLGSAISAAMVRGYQQNNLSGPLTMMSTVKHFANYGAAEAGRDYNTTDMSRLSMFNTYFPPYKAAVDEGVGCIMTSFNVVDYVPASGNKWLLDDVLRKMWGFDGFVVTDYTSINEMIAHGMGDLQDVSALALKAGVDMDMVGEGFLTTLKKSYEEGLVTEEEITIACRRILLAKETLGLFDDPYLYCDSERAKKDILSKENRDFAREAANNSAVLLKNDNSLLPLKPETKIALIGPLADSQRNMMGTWSVSGDHTKSVSVLEGMKAAVTNADNLLYAKGANISDDKLFAKKVNVFGEEISIDSSNAQQLIDEAMEIASKSDVIVAVMGEAADMAGEASSLADIRLQKSQRKLLQELKKTGKPIVLVLFNGRPMTLTRENEEMDAILNVWFPGIEAGHSIADLIYGKANPSGKLTTSFPVSVGQIPVYHSMLHTGRPYKGEEFSKFKSNFLDIPNEPLYPFGYGLSYTTFEYGELQLPNNKLGKGEQLKASITVKNTGSIVGKEVVQLYIQDLVASISRPVKELKAFQKIELAPNETKTVEFVITEEMLKFYNSSLEYQAEPGDFKLMIGTNSVDVKSTTFTLTSE